MATATSWGGTGDPGCQRQQLTSLSQLPRYLGKDLCSSGNVCLSKALLGAVVPGRSGLSVYADYFKLFSLVDDDNNLSCLKRSRKSERRVRNSMFGSSTPAKDPAHFSFDSQFDVERLGNLLGLDIVIYIADAKFSHLSIFHDFRSHSSSPTPRPCSWFLTTAGRKGTRRLHRLPFDLDSLFETSSPFFSLEDAPRTDSAGYDRFLDAVSQLLELDRLPVGVPELEGNFKQLFRRVSERCWKTTVLDLIERRWAGQKVAIVAYCRLQKTPVALSHFTRGGLADAISSHYFAPLIFFGGSDATSMSKLSLTVDNFRVVCLYAGNYLSVLSPPFVEHVISSLYRTRNSDKPSPNKYLSIAPPSRASVAESRHQ
jgi:hypothetical protein